MSIDSKALRMLRLFDAMDKNKAFSQKPQQRFIYKTEIIEARSCDQIVLLPLSRPIFRILVFRSCDEKQSPQRLVLHVKAALYQPIPL